MSEISFSYNDMVQYSAGVKHKYKMILPLFRPKCSIVVFRKSPFSLDISKSTKWIAVKYYRTSVCHYKAFTCKI